METAKVRGWSRRKSSLKVAEKVIKNSTIDKKANESRFCNFVPIGLCAPQEASCSFASQRQEASSGFCGFVFGALAGRVFCSRFPFESFGVAQCGFGSVASFPTSRAIIFQLKCILSRVDAAIYEVLNSCKLRRASCWREPNAQLWSAAMCLQWIMQSHKTDIKLLKTRWLEVPHSQPS